MSGFVLVRNEVATIYYTGSSTETRTRLLLEGLLPNEDNPNKWSHPYDTTTAEMFGGAFKFPHRTTSVYRGVRDDY